MKKNDWNKPLTLYITEFMNSILGGLQNDFTQEIHRISAKTG
jgi:hypothetical protein